MKIAMWSGPRNISTAMMRAWENRGDTVVWDEPLYAYYLAETGLDHPGREQVIAAGDTDWRSVTAACTATPAGEPAVFYQKQMTHHLLPQVGRDWLQEVVNCFLVRDPRAVLSSYVKTRENVTLADIGVQQQVDILRHLDQHGADDPIIIDSADFLLDPRAYLQAMCNKLGLAFTDKMLAWPAGKRPSDGVWGPYWYDSVWQSTGFAKPITRQGKEIVLAPELEALAAKAQVFYDTLLARRLLL